MTDAVTAPLPREIAGIRIPDSALCERAVRLARAVSPDVVFNHVLRTYMFGAMAGTAQGMRFDEELFFLGAVLHDLGLVERYRGLERFEVVGADAADAFLKEQGVPEERREIVWDAIALHTSVAIASRKRPEVALVHIGAGMDVLGFGVDALPKDVLGEILESFPRADFKKAFFDVVVETVAAAPAATAVTWMAEIGRTHVEGYGCPTFHQMVCSAPFEE